MFQEQPAQTSTRTADARKETHLWRAQGRGCRRRLKRSHGDKGTTRQSKTLQLTPAQTAARRTDRWTCHERARSVDWRLLGWTNCFPLHPQVALASSRRAHPADDRQMAVKFKRDAPWHGVSWQSPPLFNKRIWHKFFSAYLLIYFFSWSMCQGPAFMSSSK